MGKNRTCRVDADLANNDAFCLGIDDGYHPSVYIFMGAAFTYPISIVVAFIFRRKFPALVLLPHA